MNKMIIRWSLGFIAAVLLSGPVSATAQIDATSIQAKVDELVTKMQQEMIKKNFAALLLQNEMRTKMMAERVPQRFMQPDIQPLVQPAMVEKVRAQIQAQITKGLGF